MAIWLISPSMSQLLLSIQEATVTFGGKPLFEDLTFHIQEGDRICLVGKNGAGKTTLMKVITGEKELDAGKRYEEPGLTVGYLAQEVAFTPGQCVFDFIYAGLPKDKQSEEYHFMVEMMLDPFELKADERMEALSGGQLRRAALARALVEEPNILLLDEPTNHLDLNAIEWLEDFLRHYRGTLLCVSHDKRFLENISNKTFWLDRGRIRTNGQGFKYFNDWSTQLLEQEARELAKREKILAQELEWAQKGVTARRKRNVRRLQEMKTFREKLKADKSLFNKTMKKIDLEPLSPSESSRIVAEFIKVSKGFETGEGGYKPILDQFNLRIMRGDRIGILGKNGSGKSTFLKLLTGELEADQGKIKRAKTLEVSYFDQNRSDLNPDHSLWLTLCPDGGDYVEVGEKKRHVCGYLKEFLFDPKIARDKVKTLSGGQKNRLLLAKVLASPGNLLILDEPTNDLDMDTLEMLEEMLAAYHGTLIVVSHDRDFLDQTVTKILAFEGDANVEGHIGGYTDYMEASGKAFAMEEKPKAKKKTKHEEEPKPESRPVKLSYKLQYELEQLPHQISALEEEIKQLSQDLADAELFHKDPQAFDEKSKRLPLAEAELEAAELRWLELEEMRSEAVS